MARPIEKREHIERGVVRVVAEKGLRGTTIQDIADAAKVSPGLLYRYWKDRDDLAGEVYRKEVLGLVGGLVGLAARETDFFRKLQVMVKAFLQFADEQPVLLKFILLSQHDLSRSVPTDKGAYALVSRLMLEGMAQKRIRRMAPELAVQFFMGLVLQPVIGAIYGDVPRPVAGHLGEIMGAIERTLGRG